MKFDDLHCSASVEVAQFDTERIAAEVVVAARDYLHQPTLWPILTVILLFARPMV